VAGDLLHHCMHLSVLWCKVAGKIIHSCNKPQAQVFELEPTTRGKNPEVTYCHNEYQEPLVGYSH